MGQYYPISICHPSKPGVSRLPCNFPRLSTLLACAVVVPVNLLLKHPARPATSVSPGMERGQRISPKAGGKDCNSDRFQRHGLRFLMFGIQDCRGWHKPIEFVAS